MAERPRDRRPRAEPGRSSARSCSPHGRIRADLLVAREPGSILALQAPDRPRPLAELVAPYVLSSTSSSRPRRPTESSWAGAGVAPGYRGAPGHVTVAPEAFEAWRVRRGVARFPIDLDEESLPAEAGLDREPVIDRSKGCYLGQESVAKVRNLGHPTRVVVPAILDGAASAGDRIRSGTEEVGVLTSLHGANAIVRIRWAARDDSSRQFAVPRSSPRIPRSGEAAYDRPEFSRLFSRRRTVEREKAPAAPPSKAARACARP